MLTYGFYNSVNKDRRYDADQIGAMFDGLINDGVYANYKEALKIVPGSGRRQIVIRPGRAWFNGTWTLVDGDGHSFYITGSQVETTYYIYLCVDKKDRRNSIAWYSEVQESKPEGGKFFYLMGQVTIPAGVNTITEDMIVDLRGSSHCPFVTGILETADFEKIVRETCEENWLLWLNSYESGLDSKMVQIQAIADQAYNVSELALNTVNNLRHLGYKWAKYNAVLVQGGSLAWILAADILDSGGEPPKRILYREFASDGEKITLSNPVSETGLTAAEQYRNYRSAPYFNGDGYGGTAVGNVYKYERMIENVKMTGNSVTITYGYRMSRVKLIEAVYESGAYIGVIDAEYASEYPIDGYKDGYWYTRFASRASDVFFDSTGLSVSARTVQEAIVALCKTGGTGNGNNGNQPHIEVDSLPTTGVSGVIYIVKNPNGGDSDEYIWVDRWEKLGSSSASGGNLSSSDVTSIKTVLGNLMTIIKAQVEDSNGTPQGYNVDVSDLVEQNDALIAALGGSSDSGGSTEKVLTSISATYSGGSVPVGTDVSALTGITVTAYYSDGSTATVTGYTLSGMITEGSNTVTVSYQGKTTTFIVTGVAGSGGDAGGDNTETPLGAAWTEGVFLSGGKEYDNATFVASDYIGVSGYANVSVSNDTGKLFQIAVSFYDAEKTYLSANGTQYVQGTAAYPSPLVIPFPEGTAYIRLSTQIQSGSAAVGFVRYDELTYELV